MTGNNYKEFLISEGWEFVTYDKPYTIFIRNEVSLGVCYGCMQLIKSQSNQNIRKEGHVRARWNRSLEQLKIFADEGIHGRGKVGHK